MLTAKKVISIILSVVMLMSAASVAFSASAADCNHNIGPEFPDSTMVMFSEKPGTCVSVGVQAYRCTECTYITNVKTTIDPDNHTMSDWQTVTEPTCKDEGTRTRFCLNCGETEDGKIPASDNHTFIDEAVLKFWWTAEDKKIGSVYEGWEITALPTCIDEGQAKTVCTVCGEAEKTAVLDAHSYSFVENKELSKAPDCIRTGECYVFCGECNANYVLTVPVDEDAHVIRYRTVTEATCTAEGTEQAYCIWHDDYEGEIRPVAKKEHSFTDYKFDNNATCTKDGTKTAKCDYCDETDTVIAVGTKRECVTKWFFAEGVTCKTGGKVILDCIYPDCEKTYGEIKYINAGQHPNLIRYTVAPTCTQNGYTYEECPDCKLLTTVSGSEKPSTGHKYNWVTVKAGSCIADNEGNPQPKVESGVCVYCGNTETRETAVEHDYFILADEIAPLCDEDGRTAHLKCSACFAEVESEAIPALGHEDSDGNGCCDVCYEWFVEGPDGNATSCRCLCHNTNGLAAFFYKIYLFFIKLFGAAQQCDCGAIHY
ncbi:MAG: hypothetical protein IKJ27_11835 [Clostridia bacterium]|nr:hypothetical protein [Clostridia bacterium]